jgi:hypothetical protein
MNKERRKQLAEAADELRTLVDRVNEFQSDDDEHVKKRTPEEVTDFWQDVDAVASNVKDDIQNCHGDEEQAYENMPESFQQGERGEAAQSAMEAMQSAIDLLDPPLSDDKSDAIETLTNAIDYLQEAQQ